MPQKKPIPIVNPNQQDTHYPHLILDETILHATQPLSSPFLTYTQALQAEKNMSSPPTVPKERTKYVYAACINITGQIYSNQTGALPIASISSNRYICCILDDDSNCIDTIPIPSRTK